MTKAIFLTLTLFALTTFCQDNAPGELKIPDNIKRDLQKAIKQNARSAGKKANLNPKSSAKEFASIAQADGFPQELSIDRRGGPKRPRGGAKLAPLPFIWPISPCNCWWNWTCVMNSFWNLVNKVWKYFQCLSGLPCKLKKKIATMIMNNYLSSCPPWLRNILMNWFRWIIRFWCK